MGFEMRMKRCKITISLRSGSVLMIASGESELTTGATLPQDLSPTRLHGSPYAPTIPSSYRRLRRSRSLFTTSQLRVYTNPCPVTEHSRSFNNNSVNHRQSISFLRGGTEFMPASYRREQIAAEKEKRHSHVPGFSSLRGVKKLQMDGYSLENPRSLRLKVRRMSATLIKTVRRAFHPSHGRDENDPEMPAQHILSSRPYFGDYTHSSELIREPTRDGNSSQNIFMSRVNTGVPSLRRPLSSVGYPSSSGSIRIVTPPALSSSSLSSSGNTWATSTASTLRSAAGSKRLSIIPETTPRNEGEKAGVYMRNRVLDKERVYSAFLRVSRARNPGAGYEDKHQMHITEPGSIERSPSVQSRSTIASTIKRTVTFNDSPSRSPMGGYSQAPTSPPKSPLAGPLKQKENVPPVTEASQRSTKTHITIGPRITLYPPPLEDTQPESGGPSQSTELPDSQSESVPKSIRQTHSTFFPYHQAGLLKIGTSPSPFKRLRAAAMSPDAPSMYSRTTSGETPRPVMDSSSTPTLRPSPIKAQGIFREHLSHLGGRRGSLAQLNSSQGDFFTPSMTTATAKETTPPPSNTSASTYYTAKTRKDENVPFSTYIPGLMRPGEVVNEEEEALNSSRSRIFSRSRLLNSRRDTGGSSEAIPVATGGESENGAKNWTPDIPQHSAATEPVAFGKMKTGPQVLSGIDSNAGRQMDVGEKGSWGVSIGKRIMGHTQASVGIGFGRRRTNVNAGHHRSGFNLANRPQGIRIERDVIEVMSPEYSGRNTPEVGVGTMAARQSKISFEPNVEEEFSPVRGAVASEVQRVNLRGQRGAVQKERERERERDRGREMEVAEARSVCSEIGAFL